MDSEHDPLARSLPAAAPVDTSALNTPEVRASIAALLFETREQATATGSPGIAAPLRRRERARTARVAVLCAGLVLAGTGAAAAAGLIDLRTGVFGAPGMTENDTSEFLDSRSQEIPALLESYSQETPMAPGYDLDAVTTSVTSDDSLYQADGLRGAVAFHALCTWQVSWLRADAAGDETERDAATTAIVDAAEWPIWARVDGDGGVASMLERISGAALALDPRPIETEVDLNCGTDL